MAEHPSETIARMHGLPVLPPSPAPDGPRHFPAGYQNRAFRRVAAALVRSGRLQQLVRRAQRAEWALVQLQRAATGMVLERMAGRG